MGVSIFRRCHKVTSELGSRRPPLRPPSGKTGGPKGGFQLPSNRRTSDQTCCGENLWDFFERRQEVALKTRLERSLKFLVGLSNSCWTSILVKKFLKSFCWGYFHILLGSFAYFNSYATDANVWPESPKNCSISFITVYIGYQFLSRNFEGHSVEAFGTNDSKRGYLHSIDSDLQSKRQLLNQKAQLWINCFQMTEYCAYAWMHHNWQYWHYSWMNYAQNDWYGANIRPFG